MRLKIAKWASELFLLLAGMLGLAASIFAYQLHIDHNPSWGASRIILASLGGLMLLGALLLQFGVRLNRRVRKTTLWARSAAAGQAIRQRAARSAILRFLSSAWRRGTGALAALGPVAFFRTSDRRSAGLFAGLGTAITLFFYLFYITAGTFTHWYPYSHLYDLLADAFIAGQVALLEKPPAELAALPDPYIIQAREGIRYLWDASYYQGKYYFYWGPVPALIAMPFKAILGPQVVIEDQYLIFAFCAGLAVLLALFLVRLRAVFFPGAPAWTLLPLTLAGGLSIYVFALINRPSVYETAIAAGQFFLFAGLYAALRYLTGAPPKPAWLAAAGFAWGAAVCSRLDLIIAVGFFCLVMAWRTARSPSSGKEKLAALALLAAPLAFWTVALAGYNFVRFGNILETGHRYQLTSDVLPPNYSDVFSLRYVIPNLYSYLLRPLYPTRPGFPFLYAPAIKESMWPWWVRLPEHYYYPEPVAGLLTSMPIVWMALVPLWSFARASWSWLHEAPASRDPQAAPGWLWVWLAGGAGCLFIPLLVFISVSLRYLADAAPLLAVLAAMGLWWGWSRWRDLGAVKTWLAAATLALALVTVVFSLLANFMNGDRRFGDTDTFLFTTLAGWLH